jgi:RHS repeat-associated protein
MHSGLKNAGAQTDAPASGDPGIQAGREYDAFGATTASSGSWQGPFGYAGQFGYQGSAPADPLGGLMLLGHRYYDPSTGRLLTRDPVGDGSNWYAYCENDPVSFCDPDGQFWTRIIKDGAKTVRYVIFDNWGSAKKAKDRYYPDLNLSAPKKEGRGPKHSHLEPRDIGPGYKKGNDSVESVHVTTKAHADEYAKESDEWLDWLEDSVKRSKGNPWDGFLQIVIGTATLSPDEVGEGLGKAIDPPVAKTKIAYLWFSRYRWLDE